MRSFLRSLALSSLLAACAASTPAVPTTPGADDVQAAVPAPQAGAPDTSPVAAPANLVLVLRANNPRKAWETINRWQPLPVDAEKELAKKTDGVSNFIEWSESFDLALTVEPSSLSSGKPEFRFAASIPLKGNTTELLDLVEKKGDTVESLGGGRYRISSGSKLSCELWALPDRAPRVICSDESSSLREIAPWLARTLPTQEKPAEDLLLTLDINPARESLLKTAKPMVEEALGELTEELARDGMSSPVIESGLSSFARNSLALLADLSNFKLGLALGKGATLSGELSFRSRSSWFTQLYTDDLKDAPAPELFFRLPKDADIGFFGRVADPAKFEGFREFAAEAMRLGFVAAEKDAMPLSPQDKEAFSGLLSAWPSSSGMWVFAHGPTPERAGAPVKGKRRTPAERIKEAQARFSNALGYTLAAGDGSAAEFVKFLRASITAEQRFVALLKAEADQKLKNADASMRSFYKAQREELNTKEPKLKLTQDPTGYPKGSALLEVTFTFDSSDVPTMDDSEDFSVSDERRPAAKPLPKAQGSLTIFVAVVPDEGGKVAYGFSADAATLKRKLLGLRAGASTLDSLAARSDLGGLKAPMSSGGFLTAGGPLRRLAGLDAEDRDSRDLLEFLKIAPAVASTPIVFSVTGRSGETPTLKSSISVDGSVFSALAQILLAEQRSSSSKPPVAMAAPVVEAAQPAPRR
jgi:hypothetical protein